MSIKIGISTVFPEIFHDVTFNENLLGFIGNKSEGDEFRQLENLLDINLNILGNIAWEFAPVKAFDEYVELKMNYKENETPIEEIERRTKLAESIKEAWLKSEIEPEKDWISIAELENTIEQFLAKLKANPGYYEQLKFTFSWGKDYFKFNEDSYYKKYPVDYPINFIEDLFQIQYFLKIVKEIEHKYVVFFPC